MAKAREIRLKWNGSNRAMAEHDAAVAKSKKPTPTKPQCVASPAKKIRRRRSRPNYSDYIASDRWLRKRQKALQHYGSKCSRCSSTSNLQVHHVSYRRLGREAMRDLQVLCDYCHRIEHEPDGVKLTDPLSRKYQDMAANL